MYKNVLESVRFDKAEDDWSLRTTKHYSDIIKNNEILRSINHVYFVSILRADNCGRCSMGDIRGLG